jgi:hypothetical protein
MPFTPFHFGPAVLLGVLLLKKLDFPTFVAANLMVDWRAALVFLGFWPGPRHAWVHTYLGSGLVALFLAGMMMYFRPIFDFLVRDFGIEQEISRKKILLAAFSGVWLHVTLDAFHHPTMMPFMPFEFKPLYGLLSGGDVRMIAFACLVFSVPLYLAQATGRIDLSRE